MNNTDIRKLACDPTRDGRFYLEVIIPNFPPYVVSFGSSNVMLRPGYQAHPTVSPYPNMNDMRILRYLNPENLPESTTGFLIEHLEAIEIEDDCPHFMYASALDFLSDLEKCNNDIGRMLSSTGNFLLALNKE